MLDVIQKLLLFGVFLENETAVSLFALDVTVADDGLHSERAERVENGRHRVQIPSIEFLCHKFLEGEFDQDKTDTLLSVPSGELRFPIFLLIVQIGNGQFHFNVVVEASLGIFQNCVI